MSRIKHFRVNAGDITSTTEFYFKYEGKNGKILCNFCLADDGLYYYRSKSQILSPKENRNTRNSYDGYISIENLIELFESIKKASLTAVADQGKLKIKRERRKVLIDENK